MNPFELSPDSQAAIERIVVDAVRTAVQAVVPVVVKKELELVQQFQPEAPPPPK